VYKEVRHAPAIPVYKWSRVLAVQMAAMGRKGEFSAGKAPFHSVKPSLRIPVLRGKPTAYICPVVAGPPASIRPFSGWGRGTSSEHLQL
jgi:hypothetical protein